MDAEISSVEIAQKQRHLYLLQKIKGNKSLSAKEIEELKLYEADSVKRAEKKISKDRDNPYQKHNKDRPVCPPGRRGVRGGQGRFASQADLSACLPSHKQAQAGDTQLTALVAELKSVAALDSQLEEHFELEKYPRVRAAVDAAVSERIEDFIKHRFATPAQKDYRKVTLMQLVELTGRTRRTIYDWIDKGLPRNADGNFYLPSFIKWFEKYTIEKLPASVVAEVNPLQAKKAERLEMDLKRDKNELLNRDEVMAGQVARHQNLINALMHKAEELAMLANGQPQAKIAELLNDFFDGILSQQCQVPEQLHLPEETAKQFTKLLESLVNKE